MKRAVLFFLLLLLGVETVVAQTPTEDQRLSEMLREVASECAARLSNSRVRLVITPDDSRPIVAQVFAEELGANGRGVLTGTDVAPNRLNVDVRAMNSYTVSQENSSYLRIVSLSIGILAEEQRADSVLFSKEFPLSRTDTLRSMPEYEQKDLRSGDEESWIDGILTPVIATAAAVIIVVLLFTVRGS